MKNKFIALALVTLTIATTTVSCTKDDAIPSAKAQNVQTASVTVPLKTEESSNVTGRTVDRGNLPITIDGIHVVSTSNNFNWTKSFDFLLSAVGVAGDDHSFVLDNVAVGSNAITAETTTDVLPSLTTEVNQGADANNIMAKLRGNKPYAKYFGNGSATVVQGGTNTVSPITLQTKDGRNIAVFKLSAELQTLGAKVVIAPLPTANSSTPTFEAMTLSGDAIGQIYWNPSITPSASGKLFFTVTLLDKNGVALDITSQIPLGGANHNENFRLTNVAAQSINTIYTISQDALVPQTVTQQFTAQWTDNDPTNGTIGN